MKTTALNAVHKALGAKMLPFAGFEMPIQYAGVNEEHKTVRNGVGVFDVSHMGEFFIEGPNALDLIQWITSNDASKLFDGKVQYSCFPNGKGGIVDDLLVYRIHAEKYLLVVNGANIDKDWAWVNAQNKFDAKITNASDDYSLLAVQGPKAADALLELTTMNLAEMVYYTFQIGDFAGEKDIIISTTGYTGSGGFEIYMPNKSAIKIWNAIFEAGEKVGIKPIGLAARDTLRLEMGFCLYGNDIDDSTSPIEAGLGWITKFSKDFIDKEFLENQKKFGIKRKLVGLELLDKGIARHDYEVCNSQGHVIGKVTSGTMAPSLQKAIAMAYVEMEYAAELSEVFVAVRDKKLKAKVVKFPFK